MDTIHLTVGDDSSLFDSTLKEQLGDDFVPIIAKHGKIRDRVGFIETVDCRFIILPDILGSVTERTKVLLEMLQESYTVHWNEHILSDGNKGEVSELFDNLISIEWLKDSSSLQFDSISWDGCDLSENEMVKAKGMAKYAIESSRGELIKIQNHKSELIQEKVKIPKGMYSLEKVDKLDVTLEVRDILDAASIISLNDKLECSENVKRSRIIPFWRLYEKFLYKQVLSIVGEEQIDQRSKIILKETPNGKDRKIRPDIPLSIDGNNYVLDAKCKAYYSENGRNDTFQLITYLVSYCSRKGGLVYPKKKIDDKNMGPVAVQSAPDMSIFFFFIDLRKAQDELKKIIELFKI